MKINVLSPSVYNKISAGEVVERPASIIKELVENSIDAGATEIRIEVEGGGINNITVSDNGCGIDKDDLVTAFLPHATSKIKSEKDLEGIVSLGFRGEALASISAVSRVRLSSKTRDSQAGYMIRVDGGEFSPISEIARADGTTISCSNLFFNTPVRAKFLRKPKTEEAEITTVVERFMLANSHIAFQYYVDGKQIYNTVSCSMRDIIYSIYGKEVYDNLIEVNLEENGFKVNGFITKPSISKSNRTYQTLFVNGRNVENYLISSCISNVYASFLMKGRFPVYVLSITLPTDCVDVNVHPSKREVKFDNPNKIYSLISRAVNNALMQVNEIQSFTMPLEPEKEITVKEEVVLTRPEQPFVGGRSFCIDNLEEKPKDKPIEEVELGYNPRAMRNDISQEMRRLTEEDFKKFYDDESEVFKGPVKFTLDRPDTKFMYEIRKSVSETFLNASVKDEMKVLGTIFNTYIAIEYDNAVFFIDQHAAHERLLFDKLVKSVNEKTNASQSLLAPYTFRLGAKESQLIDLILDKLKSLGFEIVKSGYDYTIKSVPYILSDIDIARFVDEITQESVNLEKKTSDFIHNKLCQSACKHAIKGGDSISKDECAYIIEEVRKGVMLCPHGRPITLIITKTEFEKMFKRIV
ncbi:MAG: DNA mismatch repair endonuclease MutL [Clostridia bacterium]|nr:DNA mismatch repair endonuclease MutL [Clostridia bacterium]